MPGEYIDNNHRTHAHTDGERESETTNQTSHPNGNESVFFAETNKQTKKKIVMIKNCQKKKKNQASQQKIFCWLADIMVVVVFVIVYKHTHRYFDLK